MPWPRIGGKGLLWVAAAPRKALGQTVSKKVIHRLIKEKSLIVVNVKMRKYSSNLGEISPAIENVLQGIFVKTGLSPNGSPT